MLYDWMAQAIRDSEAEGKGNFPTVFHKQSRKELLVTMRFEDWIELYKVWESPVSPKEAAEIEAFTEEYIRENNNKQ